MAAKQGLSAQISQASEDAKRAVLQRTPLKSSWFSNLNTTCTIKSAPPRTPEVLNLLANKSGWLWKRNEQHVWQARWCCVVPHTFLYYFDSSGGCVEPPPPLTNHQQDLLNKAIKSHGNHGIPRSSFNVFSHDTSTPVEVVDKSPAGIIDLECYSSIHRSAANQLLLELAGDDSVNPDLRQFYFYSSDEQESVDWTHALISNRHSTLQDELDAFREVAGGFASQLQEMHSELDDTKEQLILSQEECYKVRSAAEEVRRTGFGLVREALEQSASTAAPFNEARKAYRQDLETAREMGLVPAVQLLGEYTRVLEETCLEQYTEMQELEKQMRNSTDNDATYVKTLQETLSSKEQEWISEKKALEQQVATMQQALLNSQKTLEDAQQELSSKRLEMTMYQTSTKNRLGELLQHKKILKKEVIGLRRKLDEVESEMSLHKHAAKTSLQTVNEERRKSELLERYVERMESQVKVQQNMMELMSHGGGGSLAPSIGGSYEPRAYMSESPRILFHDKSPPNFQSGDSQSFQKSTMTPNMQQEVQKEHNQLLRRAREMVVESQKEDKQRAREMVVESPNEDEKSHMSELTEDRTQKHFEAFEGSRHTPKRLPSYIGVQEDEEYVDETESKVDGKLETIMSASSLPPPRVKRQSSESSSTRLSVAQRSRMEADQRISTPVRARPPPKKQSSPSSILSTLGKSLTHAIDASIGIESSEESGEEEHCNERTYSDTGASEVSVMSLRERQALQRAKQLAFLKEQGLIKEESNLRGGAGASPGTVVSTSR